MWISCVRSALRDAPRVTLLLLASVAVAYGATYDTYNPANKQLSIPTLTIGVATYSNVVVTIGNIVSFYPQPPPTCSADSWNPMKGWLCVASVAVGYKIYTNYVVTIAALDSIGSVSGADTYDGSALTIPRVQVGNIVYDDVVVNIGLGSVVSVAGGMPGVLADSYDPSTGELTIPVVQKYGARIYTNVVVKVGIESIQSIASNYTILYSFPAGAIGEPFGGLTMDSTGNLYGAIDAFGCCGSGNALFKVSPSGSESVLYTFVVGLDADYPNGSLVINGSGNLVGTGEGNGMNGSGAIFEVTPSGAESLLYSFPFDQAPNPNMGGANPSAGLIMDSAGNFYGTTIYGGANGTGTVFKVTPSGEESVLHSFTAAPGNRNADGSYPISPLIMDEAGNLYGTTGAGGTLGMGTVFKISASGQDSTLYDITGDGNSTMYSGVVRDSAGNLYGTTSGGGASNKGSVFKVTPSGEGSILYSFKGGADGQAPSWGVIMDGAGNLYGTTTFGGAAGYGTVFKVTPSGVEAVMYTFGGAPLNDGATPNSGLIMDGDSNLYGVTESGGSAGVGTVFRIHVYN